MVKPATLGWEKCKWPPFTPPQTNPTFSFGARSSGNGFTNREMCDIPQGESCAGREVNHRRDSTRSNGDKGMVQCRGDGGMEEYLPFNGSQCKIEVPTHEG